MIIAGHAFARNPPRDSAEFRRYYRVENARICTRPQTLPPIYVSGFGPKAVDLAARIGDGYLGTMPDRELIDRYARAGFDEVYVANNGPHYQGLFALYAKHVLPALVTVG